jgi:hypothetical protein
VELHRRDVTEFLHNGDPPPVRVAQQRHFDRFPNIGLALRITDARVVAQAADEMKVGPRLPARLKRVGDNPKQIFISR